MNFDDILKKQQYRLKLGLVYFALSSINWYILVACCLCTSGDNVYFAYLFLSFIAYWRFFNKTRGGDQYEVTGFKILCKLNRIIRSRIKERRGNAFGF